MALVGDRVAQHQVCVVTENSHGSGEGKPRLRPSGEGAHEPQAVQGVDERCAVNTRPGLSLGIRPSIFWTNTDRAVSMSVA